MRASSARRKVRRMKAAVMTTVGEIVANVTVPPARTSKTSPAAPPDMSSTVTDTADATP